MTRLRETPITLTQQGAVALAHLQGYNLLGNEDAVCFYLDPVDRADVIATLTSDEDCPALWLVQADDDNPTEVVFPEFPGWRVRATCGGKSIAVALVRRAAEWPE